MLLELNNALQQVEQEYEGVDIFTDIFTIRRDKLSLSVSLVIGGGTTTFTYSMEYTPEDGNLTWTIYQVIQDIRRFL